MHTNMVSNLIVILFLTRNQFMHTNTVSSLIVTVSDSESIHEHKYGFEPNCDCF